MSLRGDDRGARPFRAHATRCPRVTRQTRGGWVEDPLPGLPLRERRALGRLNGCRQSMDGHGRNDARSSRAGTFISCSTHCESFIVFGGAESGITCRSALDAIHLLRAAIADAIHRSVRLLLRDVSERRRERGDVVRRFASGRFGACASRDQVAGRAPGISAAARARLVICKAVLRRSVCRGIRK